MRFLAFPGHVLFGVLKTPVCKMLSLKERKNSKRAPACFQEVLSSAQRLEWFVSLLGYGFHESAQSFLLPAAGIECNVMPVKRSSMKMYDGTWEKTLSTFIVYIAIQYYGDEDTCLPLQTRSNES